MLNIIILMSGFILWKSLKMRQFLKNTIDKNRDEVFDW